jgi:hypothetical protein
MLLFGQCIHQLVPKRKEKAVIIFNVGMMQVVICDGILPLKYWMRSEFVGYKFKARVPGDICKHAVCHHER